MGHLKAVFLDCDGVLNSAIMVDGKPTAPTSLKDLVIPAEVKPALDQLKTAGYLLICVTNKPDIDRGLMTQANVDAIIQEIRHQLPLDDLYIAYHEDSPLYKPKPGMIITAAEKYAIDLKRSFMIGDRAKDITTGQNAHCRTIWINRHYPNQQTPDPCADYTTTSLAQAAQWILGESSHD